MQLVIGGLLLMLAVLLNSIEFSAQHRPHRPPVPDQPEQPQPRNPALRPYTFGADGSIRSRLHPNAHPIIDHGVFLGMAEGTNFYPIIHNGQTLIVKLSTGRVIALDSDESNHLIHGTAFPEDNNPSPRSPRPSNRSAPRTH